MQCGERRDHPDFPSQTGGEIPQDMQSDAVMVVMVVMVVMKVMEATATPPPSLPSPHHPITRLGQQTTAGRVTHQLGGVVDAQFAHHP